jgi:hypothetical protein
MQNKFISSQLSSVYIRLINVVFKIKLSARWQLEKEQRVAVDSRGGWSKLDWYLSLVFSWRVSWWSLVFIFVWYWMT